MFQNKKGSGATVRSEGGDVFAASLIVLSPITSIVLFDLQGTTPAFILIALSFFLPIFGWRKYISYLSAVATLALCQSLFLAISMMGHFFSDANYQNVVEIRRIFTWGYLRLSNVTQSLYFIFAISFLLFVYTYFKEKMIKWAYWGIYFLAFYGLYEFLYFAIFDETGDFLSNRVFGDILSDGSAVDYLNGSLVQASLLFGEDFMRLKSLTGEPSMYSLTVVPFFLYAYRQRLTKTWILLFVTLFLTQSTTAILGMGIGLIIFHIRDSLYSTIGIPLGIFVFALLYFTSDAFQIGADRLIFEKLSSSSGVERLDLFANHVAIILDGNILRFLFGVGFGTLRSTDMFSNIIANTGLIGFVLYSALVLAPVVLIKPSPDRAAVRAAIVAIYFMQMLTVSEYSYLPPWFFVALGYVRSFKPVLVVRMNRKKAVAPSDLCEAGQRVSVAS